MRCSTGTASVSIPAWPCSLVFASAAAAAAVVAAPGPGGCGTLAACGVAAAAAAFAAAWPAACIFASPQLWQASFFKKFLS